MPEYSFEDLDTGEVVGVFYKMGKAPAFGRKVTLRGRKLKRIIDVPQVPIVRGFEAHVSRVLRSGFDKTTGEPNTKGADSYTSEGRPVIGSQSTADRVAKLNGYRYGDKALDDTIAALETE